MIDMLPRPREQRGSRRPDSFPRRPTGVILKTGGVGEGGMELQVNGRLHAVSVAPDKPLLWVLREDLGLTGTKYGCGIGQCGACTVHLDGAAVPACLLPVAAAEGLPVTTIEGLSAAGPLHPLQQAWLDAGVSQCGYCQPGMIMAALPLLAEMPPGTAEQIADRLAPLCRCGTYPRIRKALAAVLQP